MGQVLNEEPEKVVSTDEPLEPVNARAPPELRMGGTALATSSHVK